MFYLIFKLKKDRENMDYTDLTKDEVKLIQRSWVDLTANSKRVGEVFYNKLFERNPDMKSLFTGELKEQAGALMRMVKTVVEGLSNPNIIVPAIQDLGRRHHDYGVKSDQYKKFGDCLIMCLEHETGGTFDAKTKSAWQKLYAILAETMIGNYYKNDKE